MVEDTFARGAAAHAPGLPHALLLLVYCPVLQLQSSVTEAEIGDPRPAQSGVICRTGAESTFCGCRSRLCAPTSSGSVCWMNVCISTRCGRHKGRWFGGNCKHHLTHCMPTAAAWSRFATVAGLLPLCPAGVAGSEQEPHRRAAHGWRCGGDGLDSAGCLGLRRATLSCGWVSNTTLAAAQLHSCRLHGS